MKFTSNSAHLIDLSYDAVRSPRAHRLSETDVRTPPSFWHPLRSFTYCLSQPPLGAAAAVECPAGLVSAVSAADVVVAAAPVVALSAFGIPPHTSTYYGGAKNQTE